MAIPPALAAFRVAVADAMFGPMYKNGVTIYEFTKDIVDGVVGHFNFSSHSGYTATVRTALPLCALLHAFPHV